MTRGQSFKDALNFELARLQNISLNNEYRKQFIDNSDAPFYSRRIKLGKNKKPNFLYSVLKFFIRKK